MRQGIRAWVRCGVLAAVLCGAVIGQSGCVFWEFCLADGGWDDCHGGSHGGNWGGGGHGGHGGGHCR